MIQVRPVLFRKQNIVKGQRFPFKNESTPTVVRKLLHEKNTEIALWRPHAWFRNNEMLWQWYAKWQISCWCNTENVLPCSRKLIVLSFQNIERKSFFNAQRRLIYLDAICFTINILQYEELENRPLENTWRNTWTCVLSRRRRKEPKQCWCEDEEDWTL